jgi:hypothetical protein
MSSCPEHPSEVVLIFSACHLTWQENQNIAFLFLVVDLKESFKSSI